MLIIGAFMSVFIVCICYVSGVHTEPASIFFASYNTCVVGVITLYFPSPLRWHSSFLLIFYTLMVRRTFRYNFLGLLNMIVEHSLECFRSASIWYYKSQTFLSCVGYRISRFGKISIDVSASYSVWALFAFKKSILWDEISKSSYFTDARDSQHCPQSWTKV